MWARAMRGLTGCALSCAGCPAGCAPRRGFGIGLQSIFLVADQFTIDTSTGQDAYHAVVYSRRKGGYLQLTRSAHPMRRGTTITIETDKLNHLISEEETGGSILPLLRGAS